MRVNRSVDIDDDEFVFRFSRSGGPGGQNVNTRATKAELLFDVAHSPSLGPIQRSRVFTALANRIDADGVLHVTAQSARTQAANRDRALERLRELLAAALAPPPPPRKKTKPSRRAVAKRLDSKRRTSITKRARRRPGVED